jgi:hypothetical protein
MNATKNQPAPGRAASKKRFPVRLPFSLAVALSCVVPASTAFTADLLYTFDGTSIDTDTWRLTEPQSISQNNALFLTVADNPGYPAQLTTKNLALGIGSSAQVQLTLTDRSPLNNWSQIAWLALATDDSQRYAGFDSYAVETQLQINPSGPPGYAALYFYGGGYGNGPARLFTVSLNTLYYLRLERLTDTSVRYTVLDSADSVIAQDTRTLPSFTDPLYIALGAATVNATFDNLQLSGNIIIPEPSALLLLVVAAAAAIWRRTQT